MLSIRNAARGDLDGLTTVFIACFNEPPWNDGWSWEAARERLETILIARHFRGAIALSDGRPIALLLGQLERWVDAFHFNLQEMCVLPELQRTGIGRALLEHVADELRGDGTTKIYLITGPNSPAAAFYSSLGFYTSEGRIVMATVLKS